MASNSPASFLLFAFVLLATTTPLAQATFFNIFLFNNRLSVTGQVCCSATGTCPGTGGLSGATVRLVCQDLFANTNTIATTTTSTTGSFTVVAGPNSPFPFTLIQTCRVRITLPVPGCAALPTGELVSNTITVTGSTIGFPRTITATVSGYTVQ